MNLLNLATVLVIWVMATQYSIDKFIAPLLEERELQKGKSEDEASVTRNKFVRKSQWAVLFFLFFIIIMATCGYIMTLTEPQIYK